MEEEEVRNKQFEDILGKMNGMFRRKNHDYGNAFHNIFLKRGWDYALGLMENKINRIDSLSDKEPEVVGESIEDSLLDLANYAILTLMEVRRRQSKTPERIPGYSGFFSEGKL